jgi:hypothetical protein
MSLPIGQIFFNPNETVEFKSNFSSNIDAAVTMRANEEMSAAQEYDQKSNAASKVGSIFGNTKQSKSINQMRRGLV